MLISLIQDHFAPLILQDIPYIFLELDKRKRSEMKIKINFLLKSPLGEVEKINHILDIQKYENEEENRFIIWRLRKML